MDVGVDVTVGVVVGAAVDAVDARLRLRDDMRASELTTRHA